MRIEDMLVSMSDVVLNKFLKSIGTASVNALVGGVAGLAAKIPRLELTEKIKQQAVQEGLYHFVRDEGVADAIIESQHLRPSSHSTSFGRKTVFMFCGAPTPDNYAKNLTDSNALLKNNLWEGQYNPYINPTGVATAIRFTPSMDDLKNYTCRALTDGVMMYEGYCILPEHAVEKVKMVPDLVRDEGGTPVKNENGTYEVRFRQASPEELSEDGKTYNAKSDYLEFMKQKAIEYGYMNKKGEPIFKLGVKTVAAFDSFRMEKDEAAINFSQNWREVGANFLESLKRRFSFKNTIGKSPEETLADFSFRGKNPYRDPKFAMTVARFQSEQGLSQLDLKEVLSDFNLSKDGEFFQKKFGQIGDDITKKGIHGKEHSNRVALTAMLIARNEGIFENDTDNRIKEILSAAAMYHDAGRILDNGPHARNSARKISKMDLTYIDGTPFPEEDKKMVMALAEAHEGKPDKIEKMIKRYKIQDPANIEMLRRLNSIVRDADALDRVRIDTKFPNYKVNLNPKYLVNNTSKRLINAAYQLEFLTKKIPNMNNIFSLGATKQDGSKIIEKDAKEFNDRVVVKESDLTHVQPVKLDTELQKDNGNIESEISDEELTQ